MLLSVSPYIVAFSALAFAALSALTLIWFVDGLDAMAPLVTTPRGAEQAAA